MPVLDLPGGLGRAALNRIQILGRSGIFLFVAFSQSFVPPFRIGRIIKEIEFIGSKSILIIFVTGLFTGMVLGLQGHHTLVQFGAEALLGSAVALSIIRELGPVLCALMVTGRAGSAGDDDSHWLKTLAGDDDQWHEGRDRRIEFSLADELTTAAGKLALP